MATMLASGLPMLESIQTLAESNPGGRSRSVASMLAEVRERLREGDSPAQALRNQPGWFAAIDIAMIEAGQHGGNLGSILADLAQRQERSNELSHRLWGALAYPLLVMLVGLGVVVFLSVMTLPDLTKILVDAHIPIPALTQRVMWLGQALATNWLWIIGVLLVGFLGTIVLPRLAGTLSIAAPSWMTAATSRVQPPRVLRRLRVGTLAGGLAQLLRSGVPMVEALRVMAPAQQGHRLRTVLVRAAERLEHGDELSAALDDERWFDGEMRRLLDIGQASGDLEEMLTRIGHRYERRARRLIDRLTAMLEPVVLLLLATMVGTVVMAAILPLLALQEIIR